MKFLYIFMGLFLLSILTIDNNPKAADSTSYGAVNVPWEEPTARRARTADTATTADYSTTSGYASRAFRATNADNATTAGYASRAFRATNSNNADYATNAGTATSATRATNADFATKAGSVEGGSGGGGTSYASCPSRTCPGASWMSCSAGPHGAIRSASCIGNVTYQCNNGTWKYISGNRNCS